MIIVAWFVFHSAEIWPNHPVVCLWAAMVGRQGVTRVGDKTTFVRVGVESNYINKGGGLRPGLREHLACFVGQE